MVRAGACIKSALGGTFYVSYCTAYFVPRSIVSVCTVSESGRSTCVLFLVDSVCDATRLTGLKLAPGRRQQLKQTCARLVEYKPGVCYSNDMYVYFFYVCLS